MNGKFLLVNWLYSGIQTLLILWWAIKVEPVLKRTCIEIKDHLYHLKIVWISSLCPQSAYMYFCGLCCLKKDVISYSKNISDVKIGEAKLLKYLKVWNHCEAKKKRYTSKAV